MPSTIEEQHNETLKQIVNKLYEVGGLKFGNFVMKSGRNSPVYIDLRVIISHPTLMESVGLLMWDSVGTKLNCNSICGVPYNALPIATVISVKHNIPMLIRRKETKLYGTKKLIEGSISNGDHCIIIEDVVTTGSSILETVQNLRSRCIEKGEPTIIFWCATKKKFLSLARVSKMLRISSGRLPVNSRHLGIGGPGTKTVVKKVIVDLRKEGLIVTDAIILVDREQGGQEILANGGINLHSLCTLMKMMHILKESGKVDQEMVDQVQRYLKENQATPVPPEFGNARLTMKYEERALNTECVVAEKLLNLMSKKQSNLCVAADVKSASELVTLARLVGPHICLLKTHADIVSSFTASVADELIELAEKFNFMILEDRKFADIGNTASDQYTGGVLEICRWADLVTVHSLPGEGILKALQNAATSIDDANRGCFLLAEMSSAGNLITPEYVKGTVALAKGWTKMVAGLVCQSPLMAECPGFIQLTPGVRRGMKGDGLGQQWVTPEEAVLSKGADIVVVGRGITSAQDIATEAKTYQQDLWGAYLKRTAQ